MSLSKWEDAKKYFATTTGPVKKRESAYSQEVGLKLAYLRLAKVGQAVDELMADGTLTEQDHKHIASSLYRAGGRIRSLALGKRKRGELG